MKKRHRPWWRFPDPMHGWFDPDHGFCDATNPNYRREMRMISWRRP